MPEPLVSICIPTYNGQEFIEQCLQSCIDQVFDDYEIVVCDDGSTDSTIELIEKYLSANPNLRLIKNNENLGLVGNWNKCLKEAKGSWIKFVFQDDFIAPDCLREFVKAVAGDVKLIVSERNFILPANADEDMRNYYANVVRTLKNTGGHPANDYSAKEISRLAVRNMGMNFIGEPSLSFFRKDVVEEIGWFNPDLKQICDLEFLLRIASRYGLNYIPKKLCAFRIHGQTTTSKNIAENYFALHYIEPLLLSYFLLYDKHFEPLRKNLGAFLSLKLRLYFKVKAHNAYVVSQEQQKHHYLFDAKHDRFAEIWEARKGSVLVRLVNRLLL